MEGIIVENVYKIYKSTGFYALKGIDLQLHKGEFVSLLGASGSGKSTLAKLIIGLERVTTGSIMIDEEETINWSDKEWHKRRYKVQGVFQDTSGSLNPSLSVYHNVEEALVNLTPFSRYERKERILELMEIMHLKPQLLKVPTRQLSGGEQRRLALLRALAIEPKYLILDEVMGGLDLISADAVMCVLEKFHQEFDCTCLFITHDTYSAYRLSDRIIQMQNGKIIKQGVKTLRKE